MPVYYCLLTLKNEHTVYISLEKLIPPNHSKVTENSHLLITHQVSGQLKTVS